MEFGGETTFASASSYSGLYGNSYRDVFQPDDGMSYHYAPQDLPYRSFEPGANQLSQLIDVNDDLCRFGFNSPVSRTPINQISPPVSPRDPRPITGTIWETTVPQKRRQHSTVQEKRSKKQQMRKPASSSQACSPSSDISFHSSADGHRPHYAVERRYRSSLNERYASLARLVAQLETVQICQAVDPDFQLPTKLEIPEDGSEKPPGKRQSKTTTLSVAIETITMLEKACAGKAKEWESLSSKLNGIVRAMPSEAGDSVKRKDRH